MATVAIPKAAGFRIRSGHDVRRSHSLTLNSLSKSYLSSFTRCFSAKSDFKGPDGRYSLGMHARFFAVFV
jgi:hypothetical protein